MKLVVANEPLDAELKVVVDGTQISVFDLNNNLNTVFVKLEKGTHYLDLLYDSDLELDLGLVSVGDRTIETNFLFDKGKGFEAFDCEDISKTISGYGAVRFKIEKV